MTVDSGQTRTVELRRKVGEDIGPNSTCWVRYVLGITQPPSPPLGPAGVGGLAPAGFPCFFDVDMLGEVTRVYVTCADARCINDYEPEDPSGTYFLDLLEGTQVTHETDEQFVPAPPRWIRLRVSGDPPPLPPGFVALSSVYDFSGYTAAGTPVTTVLFDRQVGMELPYDPDDLPEGTVSVGIAFWNPETSQWQLLPQSTGRIAAVGTATADVTHFSTFVVLAEVPAEPEVGAPPTVTPKPASFVAEGLTISPAVEHFWNLFRFLTHIGRTATVAVTITNVGETAGSYTADLMLNGEPVAARQMSIAGGERQQIVFVLNGLQDGVHRVQVGGLTGSFTTSLDVNWWLIGLLAVLILAVSYGVFRARRRFSGQEGHIE